MTDSEAIREKVKFRPRARLLHIIGGDLIKDEMAGVVELVKNAHDADATVVRISFRDVGDPTNAALIVEDNGHGMSRSILEDGWLSPATGLKGRDLKSPGRRPMLGRKGVGRFSAMRLGRHLMLETVPGEMAPELKDGELGKRYRTELKWEDFDSHDKYLEEMEFDLETFDGSDPQGHGVILEITQLEDEWDPRRIERLHRELRLLLSPLPLQRKGYRFEIRLDLQSSGLDRQFIRRLSGKIKPYDVPQVADYIAEARIDEFGRYEFSYDRVLWAAEDPKEASMTSPTERGFPRDNIRALFRSSDRERFPLPGKPEEVEELPCGSLNIRFHIWDRDIELLQAKADQLSDVEALGVRGIRRLLDEVSGVFIYRDDFLVRPYGSSEKDWLGLGRRRVQSPVMRLGPNQLFGIIDISIVRNPGLDDKSSREGLKENEAYAALEACILGFMAWIERIRYGFRGRHKLGRPEPGSTRAIIEDRERTFQGLRELVSGVVEDAAVRKRIIRVVDDAEKAASREQKRFAEQTRVLHDTHVLGLLARFVLHEGSTLGGTLNSGLNNIERVSLRNRKHDPERIVIEGKPLNTFETSLASARSAVKRLDNMLRKLDPLTKPRRRRRPHIVVEDIIRSAQAVLEPDMQKAGVKFTVTKGSHKAVAWEADLFHAIHNLLHNSIYWLHENPSGNRKIEVDVSSGGSIREKPGVTITVSDNGQGVEEQDAPYIFDLGYTKKPDGYGVGLFIAREATERSGGSIELLNPGERGARFQIVLEGVG